MHTLVLRDSHQTVVSGFGAGVVITELGQQGP